MKIQSAAKVAIISAVSILGFGACAIAVAQSGGGSGGGGIGSVAAQVTSNLGAIAKLVVAGSLTAGMALAVAAIVKFKAHKDNPTQVPISMPIALLFVAAALIFIPSVYTTTGSTLFKGAKAATISGTDTITPKS